MDLPGGPTLQTSKAQSIGLAGENEYQDIYGINTQSQFGDYDQYNIDRVEELETALEKARGKYDTEQEYLNMTTRLRKELEDRQEYNKISGVGGDVEGDQEGMTIAETIARDDRIDAGIEAAEDDKDMEAEIIAAEKAQREENERAAIVRENARAAAAKEAAQRAEDEARARAREEARLASIIAQSAGSQGDGQSGSGSGGFTAPGGGGYGPHGGGSYGPHRAKGGLIRKRYLKGGIVDLLK